MSLPYCAALAWQPRTTVHTTVIPGAGVFFSCSDVKAVLEELLRDANGRIAEINAQVAQLEQDVSDAEAAHDQAKDNLQKALDDQSDAARELAKNDKLKIAKLKGTWSQAELSLEQARTRYETDRKRFQREREIIGRIMAKIDANCAGTTGNPDKIQASQAFQGMGAFNVANYPTQSEGHFNLAVVPF